MADLTEISRKLTELLNQLGRPSSTSSNDPSDHDFSSPQINSTYGTIASRVSSTQTIKMPFQIHVFNMTSTEEGLWSKDIASMPEFISLCSGFRCAELKELECVFQPNHLVLAHPFTAEVIWVPIDKTLSSKQMPSTYGSQSFIIGGSSYPLIHPVVKANLRIVNPRIKDSVNYNDTPRVYIRIRPNLELRKKYSKANEQGKMVYDEDSKKPKSCCVLLRGVLALTSPTHASSDDVDES